MQSELRKDLRDAVSDVEEDAIDRIEQRLEHQRSFGRDIDELFKSVLYQIGDTPQGGDVERVNLAVRAFAAACRWRDRATTQQRSLTAAGLQCITAIHQELLASTDDAPLAVNAERIIDAWTVTNLVPRHLFETLFLHQASEAVLRKTVDRLDHDRLRLRSDVSSMIKLMKSADNRSRATTRDYALFAARLHSRLGDPQRALEILEPESVGDPRVLETGAEVLAAAGRLDDAIDRLRRAVIVSQESERARELIVEHLIQLDDVEAVIEQFMLLMRETGRLWYLFVLNEYLAQRAPERVPALREDLNDKLLPLYVDLLIHEGDHDGVASASSAKTFAFEQLWRMGDFLADQRPKTAAKLYARAITLQGAVAHSKVQCADLGSRIEAVLPFFESIGRGTKPKRLARDILARQKSSIPLRREFERLFKTKF